MVTIIYEEIQLDRDRNRYRKCGRPFLSTEYQKRIMTQWYVWNNSNEDSRKVTST